MKIKKVHPGFLPSSYAAFRPFTQRDFKGICAYCFRHEFDAGGEGHFVQDHFEPKSRPGVDPIEYLNLYWCCVDCNSARHKWNKWPTEIQSKSGYVFCDPCDHNPFDRDYKLIPNGTLLALTHAAEYTIEHLRLNKRDDLVAVRRVKRRRQLELIALVAKLQVTVDSVERNLTPFTQANFTAIVLELRKLIAEYKAAAFSRPFVLMKASDLPAIRDDLIALIQTS